MGLNYAKQPLSWQPVGSDPKTSLPLTKGYAACLCGHRGDCVLRAFLTTLQFARQGCYNPGEISHAVVLITERLSTRHPNPAASPLRQRVIVETVYYLHSLHPYNLHDKAATIPVKHFTCGGAIKLPSVLAQGILILSTFLLCCISSLCARTMDPHMHQSLRVLGIC